MGHRQKKGGIHHIAFAVEYRVRDRAFAEGRFVVLNESQKGADNKLVVFLHPKSTGVLIELCQEIN
jgi:methylmalonyl-CoA/ethylmalonyl-CoA epimerase